MKKPDIVPPRVKSILDSVALAHGLTPGEMAADSSHRPEFVAARYQAMRLMRDELGYSTTRIGRMMGLHHTTVVYGLRQTAQTAGRTPPLSGEPVDWSKPDESGVWAI